MSEESPNDPGSAAEVKDTQTSTIPMANVEPTRLGWTDLVRGSYMWLVALVCLAVAIGVAWWSMPEQGIEIMIHFPDGHGLNVEDAVRFRGIDVGFVEEVKLNRELSGVDVHVTLSSFGEPLAREGTRFWIVRPELSIAGISGLDTAVGSKYIGLMPGDPEADWKYNFSGLAHAPPDALENQGVEILLRGEKRFSVTAGSPVTYRGVTIGRVLSVELSPDGLKVDARLRIQEKFTKLITSESKFWSSSGIDASFSALSGGLEFQMESIETLLRGGVSVLTVANGGKPIKPGDDFVLHELAEADWSEQAAQVQATDVLRRGAIPLEMVWDQKGFLGRKSTKQINILGTHIESGSTDHVIVPGDVLVLPEKGIEGTLHVQLAGREEMQTPVDSLEETNQSIVILPLPEPIGFSYPKRIKKSEMRIPQKPESCLAVRANGEFGDLRYLSLAIDSDEIDDDWTLSQFNGDRAVWHGAPVLSIADGKLIGILSVTELESKVLILSNELIGN